MSRRMELLQRILSRVEEEERGHDTPCWIWQGSNSGCGRGGGYGTISVDGVTCKVHRVMFTIEQGYIPPKRQVDHLCRQRDCCNPDHLEIVTQSTNMKRVYQSRD